MLDIVALLVYNGFYDENKPTTQELVNLVEFLSHRIDMLDKTQDLMIKSHMMLSNREKEVIAFCDKNRNYTESL